MDARVINPVLNAAIEVLREQLSVPIGLGSLQIKVSSIEADTVSVVLRTFGNVQGAILLHMSEPIALQVASVMMGERCTTLDAMSTSAVAELTNLVAGRAVMDLEEVGFVCTISTPEVIIGQGRMVSVEHPYWLVMPLQTKFGAVTLHVALGEDGSV